MQLPRAAADTRPWQARRRGCDGRILEARCRGRHNHGPLLWRVRLSGGSATLRGERDLPGRPAPECDVLAGERPFGGSAEAGCRVRPSRAKTPGPTRAGTSAPQRPGRRRPPATARAALERPTPRAQPLAARSQPGPPTADRRGPAPPGGCKILMSSHEPFDIRESPGDALTDERCTKGSINPNSGRLR